MAVRIKSQITTEKKPKSWFEIWNRQHDFIKSRRMVSSKVLGNSNFFEGGGKSGDPRAAPGQVL